MKRFVIVNFFVLVPLCALFAQNTNQNTLAQPATQEDVRKAAQEAVRAVEKNAIIRERTLRNNLGMQQKETLNRTTETLSAIKELKGKLSEQGEVARIKAEQDEKNRLIIKWSVLALLALILVAVAVIIVWKIIKLSETETKKQINPTQSIAEIFQNSADGETSPKIRIALVSNKIGEVVSPQNDPTQPMETLFCIQEEVKEIDGILVNPKLHHLRQKAKQFSITDELPFWIILTQDKIEIKCTILFGNKTLNDRVRFTTQDGREEYMRWGLSKKEILKRYLKKTSMTA